MDLGSRNIGPLDNKFRREVLLTMLRSLVITLTAGLYVNWELAQVQSEGLEVVNVEIMENVFVIENFSCN